MLLGLMAIVRLVAREAREEGMAIVAVDLVVAVRLVERGRECDRLGGPRPLFC